MNDLTNRQQEISDHGFCLAEDLCGYARKTYSSDKEYFEFLFALTKRLDSEVVLSVPKEFRKDFIQEIIGFYGKLYKEL